MNHDLRSLVLFLVALVLILAMIKGFYNRKIRRALVAVILVEILFEKADPRNFRSLNKKDDLERLTDELQKLGFTCLRDYTATVPGKPAPLGFSRLLRNSSKCCFAEIIATSQTMTKGLPLRVAINSYLEDGWELGTSNVVPQRGHYLQRLPRVLRMYYSDAEPAELLERHLARRAEVLQALDIKADPDLSIDSYFARIRKRTAEMRQAMQRQSPLDELPAATEVAGQLGYEWLGDFPKERKRRLVLKKLGLASLR